MSAVLQFVGGLAFFLYGMSLLDKELKKLSGGKLEGALARMCSTPLRGVLLGAAVTAAIQSSSATTVMVVGFVNAGLMTLHGAVGVIIGANLGTTVTAWILSLSGISGGAPLLALLKPESLSPILMAVGTLLWMVAKKEKLHDLGAGLVGFGLLFAGMENMSGAVAPLASNPSFTKLLTLFQNPLAGLALGAILTAVIQSSSASIGILQAVSGTGTVNVGMTVPIVMGQNIGTCITALLSSVGAEKNARRAAFLHLYFNVAGAVILLGVFYALRALGVVDANVIVNEGSVALIHTLFNVAATAILLPMSRLLVKLVILSVPDRAVGASVQPSEKQEQLMLLDDRFLGSPAFALNLSRASFCRYCEVVLDYFQTALGQYGAYSQQNEKRLDAYGALITRYEEKLGTYLVKLSSTRLTETESAEVAVLLGAHADVRRIGERGRDVVQSIAPPQAGRPTETALRELDVIRNAVAELGNRTVRMLRKRDLKAAHNVEALSGVLLGLCDTARRHHIERLRGGQCSAESASRFVAVIADVESVADHCKRLAAIVVHRRQAIFDTQRSVRALREVDAAFDAAYRAFSLQYHL